MTSRLWHNAGTDSGPASAGRSGSTTIDTFEATQLLSRANTTLSLCVLRHLTDAQWWGLATFLSQWADTSPDSDIFASDDYLALLPRAKLVAEIIARVAVGLLEVEPDVPIGSLADDGRRSYAGHGLEFALAGPTPRCPRDEVQAIRELVKGKLHLIESAVARAEPGTEVH